MHVVNTCEAHFCAVEKDNVTSVTHFSLTLRRVCRHLNRLASDKSSFTIFCTVCIHAVVSRILRSLLAAIHTHKFLYALRGEKSYFKIPIDKFSPNYEPLYYGCNIEEFISTRGIVEVRLIATFVCNNNKHDLVYIFSSFTPLLLIWLTIIVQNSNSPRHSGS